MSNFLLEIPTIAVKWAVKERSELAEPSSTDVSGVPIRSMNDRSSLFPDCVRGLLDDAREPLRKGAKLEVALQSVGHLLERVLSIPEREQAKTVCEQEVVAPQPRPLDVSRNESFFPFNDDTQPRGFLRQRNEHC